MLLPACFSFGLPFSPVCLSVSQTSMDDSGYNGIQGNSWIQEFWASFTHLHTMAGPEGQKMLEFCMLYTIDYQKMHFPMESKVSSQIIVAIRLKRLTLGLDDLTDFKCFRVTFSLKKKFDVTNRTNGFSNFQNCHQVVMYLFNSLAESCMLFWKCS